jgi:polysaccharide biosynthesis protein PslH
MKRKKILMFSTVSPVPVNRGDRIRIFQTASNLSSFADVRIVFLDRAWENQEYDFSPLPGVEVVSLKVYKHELYTEIIKSILQLKPYAIYKLVSKRVRNFVLAQIEDFKPDIFWGVQVDTYPMLQYLQSLNIVKTIDMMDSMSLHYAAARAEPNPSLKMLVTSNTQINLDKAERDCICESDCLIISSYDNLRHLNHQHHNLPENIEVVHVHVEPSLLDQSWTFDQDRPNNLLFVGYLAYPPNELAVSYVIEKILPKLQGKLPINFIVCGGGHQQLAQKYQNYPNVTFKGFVKDLTPEYLNASVMISPAPFASGIQNKLVEAMAIGLPSIISGKTAIANGVIDRQHVISCDTPEHFADAVVDLMTNEELANHLSTESRMLVVKEHTQSVQVEKLREIVSKLSPSKLVAIAQ